MMNTETEQSKETKEDTRSIYDLKSKIDAIHSLRLPNKQYPINLAALSSTINNISSLDFSSLVKQLNEIGSLKTMSFIPTINTPGEVLNNLSCLLYAGTTPWPADAGADDNTVVTPLTSEETEDIELLRSKVESHNEFINSLMNEMYGKDYNSNIQQNKKDEKMKKIKVDNDVSLFFNSVQRFESVNQQQQQQRGSVKRDGDSIENGIPVKKQRKK